MNQPTLHSTGRMRAFVATRTFVLGTTNVTLTRGTEVLFDGVTIEVDGIQHRVPIMRGAIKARWLVPMEEYNDNDPSYDRGVRADIGVRPAKGGNPLEHQPRMQITTTESDEREVRNVREHADRTAANNRVVRNQTVSGVQTGQRVQSQRGLMVVEDQDGVEVDRQLVTPAGERAKQTRIDLTTNRAVEAMRVARDVTVQPGEGLSEDGMLARMNPEDREAYLAEKDAYRSRYVEDGGAGLTTNLPRPESNRVVARVKSAAATTRHEGGVSVRTTVGGNASLSIGDETDGTVVGRIRPTHDEVVVQEGIQFRNSNLHAKQSSDGGSSVPQRVVASAAAPPVVPFHVDVRRKIAKAVCPDFPDNYDFAFSPKKKLARLQADYEDRKDVLHAVYAAESDDMKALLIQEFPQAFDQ